MKASEKRSGWDRWTNHLPIITGILSLLLILPFHLFPNTGFIKQFGIPFRYFFLSLITLSCLEILYGVLCSKFELNHPGLYLLFLLLNINIILEMFGNLLAPINMASFLISLIHLGVMFLFLAAHFRSSWTPKGKDEKAV